MPTAIDIATGAPAEPSTALEYVQPSDALEREREAAVAALLARVNNHTVSGCQRLLRETAALMGRIPGPAGALAAQHYRSAADLLDAMREP